MLLEEITFTGVLDPENRAILEEQHLNLRQSGKLLARYLLHKGHTKHPEW